MFQVYKIFNIYEYFTPSMDFSNFNNYLERSQLDKNPHQYEAVAWCVKNEIEGVDVGNNKIVRGGLIADEMGLGKTIQMIGTILSNFKMRTLIVLPLVLLEQWNDVILRTLGHQAIIYHGASKKNITLEILKNAAIVLTTYGQITYQKKRVEKNLLYKLKWKRLVFDEAHHLRNKKTGVYIGSLRLYSKIRWLITGTPIQNSKKDLFSICAAMGLPSEYYAKMANLSHLIKNFILCRTKTEVGIYLPKLTINSEFIEWKSEKEKKLSHEIHSNIPTISNLINEGNSQFNCTPLEAMTYARQSCIYPGLLKSKITKMTNIGLINEEYSQGLIEGASSSSKIDAVINTINERKENNNNKIVFCHYRGEIDIIASRLSALGINVSKFDGRTSKKDRKEKLINPVDVLILQINTACEGLNLQDYNEIYFVSPHWNPAIEDQAIARCHRIGQRREVEVFRFQMSGSEFAATTDGEEDDDDCTKTLEEYCLEVQDNKRKMREIMIENPEINPKLPSDISIN